MLKLIRRLLVKPQPLHVRWLKAREAMRHGR